MLTVMVVNFINIIALVLSPVIAVLVTMWLNNKLVKRKERMELFKTLMSTRYIQKASHERVRALNSIEVIFNDRPKVRKAWIDYYNELCKPQINATSMTDKNIKLLEIMANDLGYKEKLTWEDIKTCYMPTGLWNDMQDEDEMKQRQLQFYRNVMQPSSPIIVQDDNKKTS